jgi:outer membrane protein OmpA-like peptidoglycan-associated protein/peptidoglycan hydrolase-like protein with peptidoglycan-binding domain
MSEGDGSGFADGGGMASSHPIPSRLPLFVAPSTEASQLNSVRFNLVTIACWRLNHVLFDFDSSLVKPEVSDEVARLVPIVKANPDAPAAIFGHADPVGKDDYNKTLAGRRALAIYGMLVRDTDVWEKLYKNPMKGDTWGLRSIQTMLAKLEKSPGVPFYAVRIDGDPGPATTTAVKDFQTSKGLQVDGDPGPETRKALFRAYMDAICVSPDNPFTMDPKSFIGGGADPDLKGAVQGCGEFNPVVLFSKADEQRFANAQGNLKEERDEKNAPNRRVMLFLFRPGTNLTLEDWPCPRASEGPDGCKKMFWPDGDTRRQPKDAERHYRLDKHTFACRFYDKFARASPCEGIVKPTLRIHLFDRSGQPIPEAPFTVTAPGVSLDGVATKEGVAIVHNIPVPATVHVKWSRPAKGLKPASGPYELDVFIELDEDDKNEAAKRRLSNLGYDVVSDPTLARAITQFQNDLGAKPTGKLDDVETELRSRHDRADPPTRPSGTGDKVPDPAPKRKES